MQTKEIFLHKFPSKNGLRMEFTAWRRDDIIDVNATYRSFATHAH